MDSTLYYGGNIITMENETQVEAVFIEGGMIGGVGRLQDMTPLLKHGTKKVNLEGKTLMPSFLDSHSHLTAVATSMGLIPLQEAKSFADIIKRMREAKKARHIIPGQWMIGFSYDHNDMLEKSHPTRQVLDQVSDENPIVIVHASGHMGVFNTFALQKADIDGQMHNPVGGVIGREKDGKTPNGYLEETAFLNAQKNIPTPSLTESIKQIELAQQEYLKYGDRKSVV